MYVPCSLTNSCMVQKQMVFSCCPFLLMHPFMKRARLQTCAVAGPAPMGQ